MSFITLDLDDRSTYVDEYKQILYAEDVWSILEEDFHSKFQRILQELYNAPADIRDPFIKDLYTKCDVVFRKRYSHVIAYHACRILDPGEYFKAGLLTSTRERLIAKAREIFAGIQNLDEAIAEADVYFRSYDGSISMYISAMFAANEYLINGSHYLRMVAARLRVAEDRLSYENNKRKPVFVKCKIPLPWLEDSNKEYHFLYKYNASLIRRFIWEKANSHEEYEESPETLAIFRAVPPENIEAILSPEICLNWR